MVNKMYASRERRGWMKWHTENGGNISATCRHFGISRGTFYKWLDRYDPESPSKPLKGKSRRPHRVRGKSWGADELMIYAEMDMHYPFRGAGSLANLASDKYGFTFSRATVGRILALIRKKCPSCNGKGGRTAALSGWHIVPCTTWCAWGIRVASMGARR